MESSHEAALERWLRRNHLVITTDAAARLGISRRALNQLVAAERLFRRHPNVLAALAVSPATPAGWSTDAAAALAATTNPQAALTRRSAAWLWGWLDQPPWPIEIVVPAGSNARLHRVRVYRTRVPSPPRHRDGFRLTEPIRTLIDLADSAPVLLPPVVDRAVASRLFRFADLRQATLPHGAHHLPGVRALRAHLEWVGYLGAPAPSVLESLMARLFRDHGLARPEVEVVAGGDGEYRLDFAYRRLLLAVEVDGYVWHSSPERMQHDLTRRNHLLAAGWTVLVFTWRQVVDDPAGVAAEILRAYHRLAARA